VDITVAQFLSILERFGLPVAILLWFMLRTDRRLDCVFEVQSKFLTLVNTLMRLKCRPSAHNLMESDDDGTNDD